MAIEKPSLILVLRVFGVPTVVYWSWSIVCAYRANGFSFDMEAVWAQLFMHLISTAPLCFMVFVGMPWRRKAALFAVVAFTGMAFTHIHAAIQEAAVLRMYGEHPAARVVLHRWARISYEPYPGVWMGDD